MIRAGCDSEIGGRRRLAVKLYSHNSRSCAFIPGSRDSSDPKRAPSFAPFQCDERMQGIGISQTARPQKSRTCPRIRKGARFREAE